MTSLLVFEPRRKKKREKRKKHWPLYSLLLAPPAFPFSPALSLSLSLPPSFFSFLHAGPRRVRPKGQEQDPADQVHGPLVDVRRGVPASEDGGTRADRVSHDPAGGDAFFLVEFF